MKTIALIGTWLVLACGSTPPPAETPSNGSAAPELSCKTAVEHGGEVAKLRPKQVTMAIGECDQQGWSRALRECVDTAKTTADLGACATKHGVEKRGIFAEAMGFAEAMKAMHRFKDEMCVCRDTACAQKISDEMTKWSQEQAKDQKEPPRMSDEDVKEATALGEEMGRCMQKAMGAGTP